MRILCSPPVLRDAAKAVDMATAIDHHLVEAKNENTVPRPMTIIGTETMTVGIAAPKRKSVEVLPRRKSAAHRVATIHRDGTTGIAIVEIDKSRTTTRRKILRSNPLVRLRVFRGVPQTLQKKIRHRLESILYSFKSNYRTDRENNFSDWSPFAQNTLLAGHFIDGSRLPYQYL